MPNRAILHKVAQGEPSSRDISVITPKAIKALHCHSQGTRLESLTGRKRRKYHPFVDSDVTSRFGKTSAPALPSQILIFRVAISGQILCTIRVDVVGGLCRPRRLRGNINTPRFVDLTKIFRHSSDKCSSTAEVPSIVHGALVNSTTPDTQDIMTQRLLRACAHA